jgi:hypothetical protein
MATVAATLAIFWWGPSAHGAESAGSVTALEGRAEALHTGVTTWAPLAVGDAVLIGDQVRTLQESKLKLLFRDQSLFTLAPSSTLTVTEQVAGAAAPVSRFSLLLGTVRAVVNERYGEPGARFEMNTPTAVAAVHGTGFIATYDPAVDESVFVGLFDTTLVRGQNDPAGSHEVRLGPGDTTRVGRGSLPLPPTRIPEGVLRGLNAATTTVPDVGGGGHHGGPGSQGKGGTGAHGDSVAASPESPVDQPVQLLNRAHRRQPPPPPPVPR